MKNHTIAIAEKILFLRPGDIQSHTAKENILMLVHQLSCYAALAYIAKFAYTNSHRFYSFM